MAWKPFNTEFPLESQGAQQDQFWDMLSKKTSYDDDRLQGSSKTQREYIPELNMNVVSLPISQNPKWFI